MVDELQKHRAIWDSARVTQEQDSEARLRLNSPKTGPNKVVGECIVFWGREGAQTKRTVRK